MNSPMFEVCFSVLALEAIAGLFSNVFIILSLTISSFEGTNIAPYNNILIALNVSNMCYTIVMSVNSLMFFFWPSLNLTYISNTLKYFSFCSIICSSWMTASLCFFYFIKILQFQSRFFVWMKMKIDRMIPSLILIVGMTSLFESFIALYIFNQKTFKNSTMTATDMTSKYQNQRIQFMNVVAPVTSLPFLIAIFTTTASAVSLHLHNRRMKANMANTSVRDYQSAVQTMTGLIVFYVLISIAVIGFGQELFAEQSWGYWMCLMVLFSFSVVQSGLLINGNPKLKEDWGKLFTFP